MKVPVYVCIPYRAQRQREKYFQYCVNFWKGAGYEVLTANSDPLKPFSLAEARNNCVKQILDEDAVCIIIDADTVPEWTVEDGRVQLEWIEESIRFASKGKVVYPFSQYRYMSGKLLETDYQRQDPIWSKQDSVGGCVVVSKRAYWYLGGMDDEFHRTWGYEDNAFYTVAETLSTVVRLPGKIYSFEHKVDDQGRLTGPDNPNFWRYKIYIACFEQKEMMRELIRTRVERFSEESSTRDESTDSAVVRPIRGA